MGAKLQAFGRGGQGGEQVSDLRRRIARLAEPHVDEAFETILSLMRTARRETVRFDAAVTVMELAEGAETEGQPGESLKPKGKILVIDRRQMSDAIAERQSKESA